MRSAAAERNRRRALAHAGLQYAQARMDRLEALLADPASWRWIAGHALDVRSRAEQAGHGPGTHVWDVLTRLHVVAGELLEISADPPEQESEPESEPESDHEAEPAAS